MDLHNSSAYTRRAFLFRGMTLASAVTTIPCFLQRSAFAMMRPDEALTSRPVVPDDRVLVVVQLGGGNDGLNTVIPFADPQYYRVRQTIGIPERELLQLAKGSGVGLHPRLAGVKDLYDNGLCAVVQGVGYPNPNRSHFASMDIWHTGETSGTGDGWLGRYFDCECEGTPGQPNKDIPGESGIALGRTAPLAMQGRLYKPISFETPDLFRWTGLDLHESLAAPYETITRAEPDEDLAHNPNAQFLMRTALDAQVASDRIRKAVESRPLVAYPGNELARQLAMVAAMIRAGLETRVYYVTLGGFDTHAGQGGANGRHANLMDQFSSSVAAFYADLKAQGNDKRVLTMSFSEFGRRVAQNGSGGTDHGTAAPMFFFGPMVKAGVHGRHPSLTDLDDGDLKFHTDFRSVYADVLTSWMRADPKRVLGGSFKPASVVASR